MNIFFPPHQEIVAVISLASGIAIGLLYDLFVIKRMLFSSHTAVLIIDDILFMLLSACIFMCAVFVTNNGIIRWYEIVCTLTGFTIYKYTISKLFIFLCDKVTTFIKSVFKAILKFAFKLIKFTFLPLILILRVIILLLKRIYVPINRSVYLHKCKHNICLYINRIGC